MSNFLGWFFHVLGGKKNLKNFSKHFSNRIEKLHKMAFILFFSEKFEKSWKDRLPLTIFWSEMETVGRDRCA